MEHERFSGEIDDAVTFSEDGDIIINADANCSKKLTARRAIEAYKERKELEKYLDDFYFKEEREH